MDNARRSSTYLLLAAALTVLVLLRIRWFGHLLMWDEAMNILSVRAFAAAGHDPYSSWFWRYPPLLNSLLLLIQPLQPGFVFRAECLMLAIGIATCMALWKLNREAYGPGVACLSALAFAVMPGAVFHGLWIKQDALAMLAGLLALWLAHRERWIYAGLALGAAMLAKQTGAFYALAVAALLLRERRVRELALVAAIAGVISIWWYALFSTSDRHFLQFAVSGRDTADPQWNRPWHYYAGVLWRDLGPLGAVVALVGFARCLPNRQVRAWPIAVAIIGLLILTLVRGKTPWYAALLYPAFATLQGLALHAWTRVLPRGVAIGTILAFLGITAYPLWARDYETHMREREPGMWDASYSSREAAQCLNERMPDNARVLVTPMHYYGPEVRQPCPIFVVYLKDVEVLVRANDLTADQFVSDVREFQLHGAMVSPPPERAADLLQPLAQVHGLKPVVLRNAVIYDTSKLLQRKEDIHD